MSLCFIEPQNAIRVIADSVGREARRQILGEVVRAWVDEIPESELGLALRQGGRRPRRARPVAAGGLARVAGGRAIRCPNKEFLVNVFPSLGENRREALKIAAGFRGEEAFEAGVGEEQAFDTVLPWLSRGALHVAGRRVPGAVLLGPPRRRELERRAERCRRARAPRGREAASVTSAALPAGTVTV